MKPYVDLYLFADSEVDLTVDVHGDVDGHVFAAAFVFMVWIFMRVGFLCLCVLQQVLGFLGLLIWSLAIATPYEILDATARIATNSTRSAEHGATALRWFNGITAAVAGW